MCDLFAKQQHDGDEVLAWTRPVRAGTVHLDVVDGFRRRVDDAAPCRQRFGLREEGNAFDAEEGLDLGWQVVGQETAERHRFGGDSGGDPFACRRVWRGEVEREAVWGFARADDCRFHVRTFKHQSGHLSRYGILPPSPEARTQAHRLQRGDPPACPPDGARECAQVLRTDTMRTSRHSQRISFSAHLEFPGDYVAVLVISVPCLPCRKR